MTTEFQPEYPPTETPEALAARLNLPFRDPRLVARSLTHRSFINENPDALEDNERLEFLGDAVLDFLVGAWLYHRYPEMAEGKLTRLRSALVGTRQLAEFARTIDLGRAMRLGRGEVDGGGRNRDNLLCGTFEALVGALFIDSGFEPVRTFVEPLLADVIEDIIEQRDDVDAKSSLQEWAQSKGLGVPHYHQVEVSGPDHERIFTYVVVINGETYAAGQGNSKQEASKNAAAETLRGLGVD
ncbi:MAG TPA: ribonuclease III [Anaerolineales bacterium]|nr:ribonuclease III [Anaerolineales bacterium]